ncbi:MAG: molybdopterin-dependent oxidoreductase [Chloroflexota bacterium]|nr:molybdopterin-dependent oxidoreductase [Chloroflexota bacterium]
MQPITITLNGVEVSGHSGMTILDLARESGVTIPTLCHDPHLDPYGACRICLVEDERNGALLASCVAPIAPGMVINTLSEKVLESRRTIIKLMLASHPDTCMVCDKGNRCELRQIATDLGIGLSDLQRIPHPAAIQEVNPFIERDLSKCIMCAKCIRADHELVVEGAIDYLNRGFSTKPATLGDLPLELSDCTFCGTCVAFCPTGALAEKIKPYRGTTSKVVSTVCSFCGCGCNLNLEVSGNQIVRVRPGEMNSPNGMTLCARGAYGYDYIHSSERLTQPLLKVDGEFQPVSWDEALSVAAAKLEEMKSRHGSESLAVFGSSKCTNEENYILQKFAREVLGTNNIDNGGRLYNATSRMSLGERLGYPASTNPIDDIEQAEVILLVGSDPEISAPLVSYSIKRAVKQRGAKLLLINPWRTGLNRFAHLWLRPRARGGEALVTGLVKVIIGEGLVAQGSSSDDVEALANSLESLTMEQVEAISGVAVEDVQQAARIFAGADRAVILYGIDIIGRADMSRAVSALASLSMLTGNMGRTGGGIYALQKENNGQGALDMGCLPDFLPGYQPSPVAGLTAFEMIEQAKAGRIKSMYIVGENPASGFPDPPYTRESLSAVEFLVVQDLFLTETAKLAHLVLPAASFAEKDGTFTSFERRVQRVRQAIEPIGGSLPDWQIVQRLAGAMGHAMQYSSAEHIFDEISATVPQYQGLRYADMESGGVYWPRLNEDRAGTKRLYEDGFAPGFGRLSAIELPSGIEAGKGEKAELLVGRTLYQFGSGARSSRSARLSAMLGEILNADR